MKKKATFKIAGMHCASCSINIDGELEDTQGVQSAATSYAKQYTVVEFDSDIVSEKEIIDCIKSVGYEAVLITS